jgi:hypothetical protein
MPIMPLSGSRLLDASIGTGGCAELTRLLRRPCYGLGQVVSDSATTA